MLLRILSDLHFRDATSKLRHLEDLEPLLHGVSELWLNGDTCDNQSGMPPAELDQIRRFFTSRVPTVRFITGNHDPDISTIHEAHTSQGRLWAVHGDVFLDDIVPWSRGRHNITQRLANIRRLHPMLDYDTLPDRFQIQRTACLGFRRECNPEQRNLTHRAKRFAIEVFPPRQPWAMLHTWLTFSRRAIRLAQRWRPDAQIIVTGHVHFPRVWHHHDKTVINTGAFSSPFGAYCVDVVDDAVTVHRLRNRQGKWHPGRVVASIPLAPKPLAGLTTAL
ncbi:MAG: metallophosphoesterase family protein [Candidatus Synoicihabitans palmerolidicus]|nr:metallophosphoesterase family protein [Candidatus Synoicihabitans palmerolidicus]